MQANTLSSKTWQELTRILLIYPSLCEYSFFPEEILMCLIVGCCPPSHWEHYFLLHALCYPAKTWTFLNSETYSALNIFLYKALWTWTTLFDLSNQMFTNRENTENAAGGNLSCLSSTACYLADQGARQPLHDPWTWGRPRSSVLYPACSREWEVKFQGWNLQITGYTGILEHF